MAFTSPNKEAVLIRYIIVNNRGEKMDKNDRIQRLTKHYDLLKDSYYYDMSKRGDKAECNLGIIAENIIVPMLELDLQKGVEMWLYMLQKYCKICDEIDYYRLTGGVIEKADFESVYKALKYKGLIRQYVFAEERYRIVEDPIYYALKKRDTQLADILTELLFKNDHCKQTPQYNLWMLLLCLNTNSILEGYLSKDVVLYARKWVMYLTDWIKRAEIELKIDTMEFEIEDSAGEEDEAYESAEDTVEETAEEDDTLKGTESGSDSEPETGSTVDTDLEPPDPDLAASPDYQKLRFCTVVFDVNGMPYTYYCPDAEVKQGDIVKVCVGNRFVHAIIEYVFYSKKIDLKYPWERVKRLIWKTADKNPGNDSAGNNKTDNDLKTEELSKQTNSSFSEDKKTPRKVRPGSSVKASASYYKDFDDDEDFDENEEDADEEYDEELDDDEDDEDEEEEDEEVSWGKDSDSGWYPGSPESELTADLDSIFDLDGNGELDEVEDFIKFDTLFEDD